MHAFESGEHCQGRAYGLHSLNLSLPSTQICNELTRIGRALRDFQSFTWYYIRRPLNTFLRSCWYRTNAQSGGHLASLASVAVCGGLPCRGGLLGLSTGFLHDVLLLPCREFKVKWLGYLDATTHGGVTCPLQTAEHQSGCWPFRPGLPTARPPAYTEVQPIKIVIALRVSCARTFSNVALPKWVNKINQTRDSIPDQVKFFANLGGPNKTFGRKRI